MLTDVVSRQKTEFPAKKPGLTSFCQNLYTKFALCLSKYYNTITIHWGTLWFGQRYGAQNIMHSPLAIWGGDIMVGCSASINERLLVYQLGNKCWFRLKNLSQSVDIFNQSKLLPGRKWTWLRGAEPIRGIGQDWRWRRPMVALWVILWRPPLILDGYVMNDIWTIVQKKIACVTYRSSP